MISNMFMILLQSPTIMLLLLSTSLRKHHSNRPLTTTIAKAISSTLGSSRPPATAALSRLFSSSNRLSGTKKSSDSSFSSSAGVAKFPRDLITSTKSNTVKKIQALKKSAKKRADYGSTLVEGPRMIFDLLKNVRTAGLVQQIIVDEDKWSQYAIQLQEIFHQQSALLRREGDDDNNSGHPVLAEPRSLLLAATPKVLQACTDTVTNQGIVAIVDIPNIRYNEEHLVQDDSSSKDIVRTSAPPVYLVLDAVSDPGNLGTLIRSATATGAAALVCLPGTCDPWNPKAVRSAMGTTFTLPIWNANSWEDCCEQLLEAGCSQIWAATMLEAGEDDDRSGKNYRGAGTSHFGVDWMSEPAALVIGSEGNGLTQTVRQAVKIGRQDVADSTSTAADVPTIENNKQFVNVNAVHVPMQAGIESLNAAVCGSVIMFEYLRQKIEHEK